MTRRERLVLLASTIGFSMVLLDTTTVNVALGSIARELHAGATTLQWVVNAYTLAFAGLLLSTGAAADRVGPRRVFLYGLVMFAVGSLAATLSPSSALLVAAQALLGVGAALVLPTSLSLLSQVFVDPARRMRAVGIWATGSAISFAAGPVVGGLLIQQVSWRAVFVLNLPLVVVAAAITITDVPVPRLPIAATATVALVPQAAAIAVLVALTFGLIESAADGWGSPVVLGALTIATTLGGALFMSERRTPRPLIPRELAEDRRFLASTAGAGLLNFAFYGEIFFLSLFLQEQRGLDPLQTGLLFLPQPVAFMAVSTVAGRLVAARGPRPALLAGGMIGAGGAITLLAVGRHGSLAIMGVGMVLNGIGGGLAIPAVTGSVMGAAPQALAGIASAAFTAGRQVGGVFGVAVLGGIATADGHVALSGMRWALVIAALALAAAAALSQSLVDVRSDVAAANG